MTDHPAKPLSDEDVRKYAKTLRDYFGVRDCNHVDILSCLNQGTIWTLRGVQRLNFLVRPDGEMGNEDGATTFGKGVVTISVKQSVRDAAFMGVGRPRNTLAHELGHGVLHYGRRLFTRTYGASVAKHLKPYESAEHQAKIFAPAFLINDAFASTLGSAEEISLTFGVSTESADIYFKGLIDKRDRQASAERIRQVARQLADDLRRPTPQNQYISDPCAVCGRQTLVPIGNKFLCTSCDTVYDRFQDGDR
jgi:hypothetical protein